MNNKQEIIEKLFCDELYRQVLKGEIFGNVRKPDSGNFLFRVKKIKLTEEDFKNEEEKIFKQNVLGYHYTFSFGPKTLRFVPLREKLELLKETLKTKDFPICH